MNNIINPSNDLNKKELNKQYFKKFCENNPSYFKEYYLNNIQNEYYYCLCCKKEYRKVHKSRHEKTMKHKNNIIVKNTISI